jgi:hypothetical protein
MPEEVEMPLPRCGVYTFPHGNATTLLRGIHISTWKCHYPIAGYIRFHMEMPLPCCGVYTFPHGNAITLLRGIHISTWKCHYPLVGCTAGHKFLIFVNYDPTTDGEVGITLL